MEHALAIEDEIVAAVRRIVRGIDLHSSRLVREVGLTWPQLAALRAVDRLGPCSISALARGIHLGQATLTGILQRLERAGYVARTPDETDRRSVRISVTDGGRALLRQAPSLLQDRFRSEIAKLRDWERLQLLASLKRVAEMMDVEALDASPFLVAGPVHPSSTEPHEGMASEDAHETSLTSSRTPQPKRTTKDRKSKK
jgi:DNA-binding MarR family transcriptional regulator